MPARRRIHGSESDDNFSVLIDGGTVLANENNQIINNQHSGDNKKEYITAFGQNQTFAGFAIPNGLTKFSSSIGQFLQQQVTQQVNTVANVKETFLDYNPQKSNQSNLIDSNYDNNSNDDDSDSYRASEIITMASRDRTGEFFNAIRSMQGRNIAQAVNIRDPRKATQLQSYSEFMMIAKHIGKNIASTYSKLEKLTICKLFDCCVGIY